MSTFLQIVNQVREECGVSGPALTTLGGALSQTSTRVKNWVINAWIEIQRAHRDWNFLENSFSFATTPGVQEYTASAAPVSIANFANWKRDTLRCYQTAVGVSDEQILPFMDWQTFRDVYQFGQQGTTQARPVCYTIGPRKTLLLGPTPDVAYTVSGWYYHSPTTLVADADTPDVDAEYHELIVFKAMVKYGMYEAAPEIVARGQEQGDRVMAQLEADYLPTITFGAPLA
jgi:hypothetical protein